MLQLARLRNMRFLGISTIGLSWLWLVMILVPFGDVLGLLSIQPLVLFTAYLFVCDGTLRKVWLRAAAKVAAIAFFLYHYFYAQEALLSLHWIQAVGYDTIRSLVKVGGRAFDATTSGQMLLLLICLWIANAVVYHALRYRWAVFTLLILGEGALGLMDAFYTINVSSEVFVFLIIGFVLLASTQFGWLTQVVAPEMDRVVDLSEWFISALLIGTLISAVGLFSPKALASWPDPVGWWNSYGSGIGEGHKKIGYGNDDTVLGGPFIADDQVAMVVKEDHPTYLRGESKDVYTGRGWESGEPDIVRGTPGQLPFAQLQTLAGYHDLPFQQMTVTVTVKSGSYGLFLAPYEVASLGSWTHDNRKNTNFAPMVDLSSYRLIGGPLSPNDQYTVTSYVPTSDAESAVDKAPSTPVKDYPLSVQSDLQLPKTVPTRVLRLAEQITGGYKNPYEKVMALRDYLKNNFSYETKDVPIPGPNQDFVDQFLFQSKRGYCDHFSSALVVMTRELGIPARWVKGFASGDLDTASVHGDQYIIKNQDAHSWVEVYFTGIGWFPFDPTPSFSIPLAYTNVPTTPVAPVSTSIGKDQSDKTKGITPKDTNDQHTSPYVWVGGLIGTLIVLVGLVLLSLKRKSMLATYRQRRWGRYAKQPIEAAYLRAIYYLLRLFARIGWRKDNHLTLREFSSRVIRHARTPEEETAPAMTGLTVLFEDIRYGEKPLSQDRYESAKADWGKIVSAVTQGGRQFLRRRSKADREPNTAD